MSRLPLGPTRASADPAVWYLGMFVVIGLSLTLLGPALSDMRRQVGASVSAISVLFVVQSLGYLGGSIVGGRLYDRGFGHRALSGALVVCAIGMAAIPAAGGLAVLSAMFALVGIGGAVVDVGGNTLLVWSRGASVGPMMNALHLCFGVGALLSPFVVDRSVAWGDGLGIACWFTAALALVVAVPLLRLPAPTRTARPRDDRRAASAAAARGSATETAIGSPSATGDPGRSDPAVPEGSPGRHHPPVLLVAISFFFVLYVGVELGFAGWVHTYAEEIDLGGPSAPALLTGLFWAGFTGGRLVSVPLARVVRPSTMLLGSCIVAVAAAGALVVADGGPTVVWIATFVFGLGVAPQFPTMISFADAHLRLSGSDTSWFVAASALGGLILPWVIGQVIGDSDAQAMPVIVFLASAATLGWLLVVRRMAAQHDARTAMPAAASTPPP